jgi:hypothetical protein
MPIALIRLVWLQGTRPALPMRPWERDAEMVRVEAERATAGDDVLWSAALGGCQREGGGACRQLSGGM